MVAVSTTHCRCNKRIVEIVSPGHTAKARGHSALTTDAPKLTSLKRQLTWCWEEAIHRNKVDHPMNIPWDNIIVYSYYPTIPIISSNSGIIGYNRTTIGMIRDIFRDIPSGIIKPNNWIMLFTASHVWLPEGIHLTTMWLGNSLISCWVMLVVSPLISHGFP